MKVHHLTRRVKSRLGIKDLKVNLIRLDKETIHRFMGLAEQTVVNYNLSLRMKNGDISRICDSGAYVPMVITIESIHATSKQPVPSTYNRDQANKYSLRIRIPEKKTEKPAQKSTTTVSVVSTSVRNRQLWANCKKMIDKGKIIEGAICFAKQVLIFVQFAFFVCF